MASKGYNYRQRFCQGEEHLQQRKLSPLLTSEQIAAAVSRLAAEVARDYRGKCPLLIGVLKGSFMFMADLVRCIASPVEVEFVTLSSYGTGTRTTGKVQVVRCLRTPVKNRDVIVVEDIVDTGLTLDYFLKYLWRRRPASVKVCALLDKVSRRQVGVPVDYRGFVVPGKFVVGYGIDWSEQFRYLPGIYVLEEEDKE